MGALKKYQQNSVFTPKQEDDIEQTYNLSASSDQEATMATVMMTRLHDTTVKTKFNRILLMGPNDKVTATYPLNRKITSLGRSRQNNIRIQDPLVSVKHLSVSVSGSSCVVSDLESSNGTFINGERLDGARVLQDGEEIMVGKTVLRYAARRDTETPKNAGTHRKKAAMSHKSKSVLLGVTVMLLLISTALTWLGLDIAEKTYEGEQTQPVIAQQKEVPAIPAQKKEGQIAIPGMEANKTAAQSRRELAPSAVSPVQEALEDYRAGRLDSAVETLTVASAGGNHSTEKAEARRLLSKINNIMALHAEALLAQNNNNFTEALVFWDRLLIADAELIGDRPSFFAHRAAQTVQSLTYEQAIVAYKSKQMKKAAQLCRVMLQINPANEKATALLAKIEA